MPIVGGLDIHRKQITFDYLDTGTGQVQRGQVSPADREHLRAWLARFAGRDDVAFAVEGCTGWRYVTEELAAAGVAAHLAEPADTAFARGRKRHAKTDKTDCRHLRMLLSEGRLPECWIPPGRILECRAMLETYHDLRREHTAWVQRIHAVLFHHGAPAMGGGALRTRPGLAALRDVPAACLSPAGQLQVATALEVLEALEARMSELRHQLLAEARHLTGAKVLAERLYGVGPFAALAMTCWLAGKDRFSSSRQAVRFAGLDVTVWSSDRKGPPGRLSRQGPPVLRWTLYEAGKTHARAPAPDHAYYAAVKDRCNGKRAALSEARKILRQAHHILAELGDDALSAA
jgi:transposase